MQDRYFLVTKRSDKQYSTRVRTSIGIPITLVHVYGEIMELFGGGWDDTETFVPTTTENDMKEIIDATSFVYDIDRDTLVCRQIQESEVDRYLTRLINIRMN